MRSSHARWKRLSLYMLFILLTGLLLAVLPACTEKVCSGSCADDDGDTPDGDSDGDRNDGDEPDGDEEPEPLAVCGDGECQAGEHCLNCPRDCDCACGDGACSFGEFCAICPQDCDCESLAATPPMGWNSWNKFACNISETLIRETADAMVASGMRDAGYLYLNLDDCWQTARDGNGRIVEDPELFPSGIAALAEYVHAKGLKFGLYTCAGTMTCQERPGSYSYEQIDAQTYAEWGVDYIKVDWCFTDGMDSRERFRAMHEALSSVERPIVHSICNWGVDSPHIWGPEVGQLWRTTPDIADVFGSAMANFRMTEGLSAYAWPGTWNDPDMLEVGNGGMTDKEYIAHMSLWAIIAAPLIAGNDVTSMSESTLDILLNPEVIAVNQDPSGLAGVRISDDAWARPLTKPGLRAVVMFNSNYNVPQAREIRWEQLGLKAGKAQLRDVWNREDLGEYSDLFRVTLQPYETRMVLVQGSDVVPEGELALSQAVFKHSANSLGPVERDRAVGGGEAGDGGPLQIGDKTYAQGLGVAAASIVVVHLGGGCTRFVSDIGLDASAEGKGSVVAQVWADGMKLYESSLITGETPVQAIDVDVTGRQDLVLRVTTAGDSPDFDYFNWADARLSCADALAHAAP